MPVRSLLLCLLLTGYVVAQEPSSSNIAGNYKTRNGAVFAIAPWETEKGRPKVTAFTDFETGRFGVLKKEGDSYVAGPGLFPGEKPDVKIAPERGRILYTVDDNATIAAERIPNREEDVNYESAGLKMQGTLLLPPGDGPFPAVVLVPAGDLGRHATATFPNFFLSLGMAVLTYDRRPNRPEDRFYVYASDALAGVEYLRSRPDIDPKKVGFWGHSQGAWLSILAASKSNHVAFVIEHAGMLMPAWQQELYRVKAESAADGLSSADVQRQDEFIRKEMEVARTGLGWEALAKEIQAAKDSSWIERVYVPKSLDSLMQAWNTDFSFDPTPSIKGVRCPVLGLFGELDKSTPPEAAKTLETELKKAGNKRVKVVLFPAANHAFFEAKTGGNAELPELSRFVPGMFRTMREWLQENRLLGK